MPTFKAVKIFSKLNQKQGIDCPGCAWPDPKKPSSLGEFCENGAKAIAEEAMSAKVDAKFFNEYTVRELEAQSDYWLGQQGRLTEPMIITEGSSNYKPISWEKAFDFISKAGQTHLKK